MKINVEFDLTPDEFRQSLGLPDVEAFQKDLMDRIHKQMESGVEGYDPMSLMRPFLQQQGMPQQLTQGLSQGLSSFGSYQQMMLDMLRQASTNQNADSSDSNKAGTQRETSDKQAKASSAQDRQAKPAASSAERKSTASARSRAKRES
ncbi:hypothetical protein KG088_12190 [Halomonas sp. TRM85114]|uniref:hypothetical protein n=1 Tax=Halomonas jincaotanensis TaxID=2810616 RepID=UPI001BD50BAF|nr:hypothetical protein [Halomonas jincaotanensis]MBS9404390.1 hypothetical protein [Halomonas jincaotanensis]